MIKFLERLLCDHKWNTCEKEIDAYYDFSGFRVRIFQCECIKCGKRKKRKYY